MPLPPVAPAVAAIVAASRAKKALATLKAITPGVIQRRFDQELRWRHESLLKAYESVGSHDPKWDEIVRQALTLAARVFAQDPTRPGDATERLRELFGKAVEAGCDDPLIGYLHARYADPFRREGEVATELVRAATKLEQSKYPAFRRPGAGGGRRRPGRSRPQDGASFGRARLRRARQAARQRISVAAGRVEGRDDHRSSNPPARHRHRQRPATPRQRSAASL